MKNEKFSRIQKNYNPQFPFQAEEIAKGREGPSNGDRRDMCYPCKNEESYRLGGTATLRVISKINPPFQSEPFFFIPTPKRCRASLSS